MKLLVGSRARFTVVGDDDQSIYSLARRTSSKPWCCRAKDFPR
ncbi:UvrD-helicase domain-containing protein [Shigella flexneri]